MNRNTCECSQKVKGYTPGYYQSTRNPKTDLVYKDWPKYANIETENRQFYDGEPRIVKVTNDEEMQSQFRMSGAWDLIDMFPESNSHPVE